MTWGRNGPVWVCGLGRAGKGYLAAPHGQGNRSTPIFDTGFEGHGRLVDTSSRSLASPQAAKRIPSAALLPSRHGVSRAKWPAKHAAPFFRLAFSATGGASPENSSPNRTRFAGLRFGLPPCGRSFFRICVFFVNICPKGSHALQLGFLFWGPTARGDLHPVNFNAQEAALPPPEQSTAV